MAMTDKKRGTTTTTPASVFGDILDGSGTPIDPLSGIPVEEQEEILAQIDGIAEKNRKSFAAGTDAGLGKGFKAKKNGGLFPMLVNILAVLALVGGFWALYSFQLDADIQARGGERGDNPAIRALIEEIRRRTAALLETMDLEIALLTPMLTNIEIQLQELFADGETPTEDQLLTQSRLYAQREEYRAALALAWEERSRILEDARAEEMEARAWIPGPATAEDEPEPGSAFRELAAISGEQRRATTVEAQVAGLITVAHRQVAERNFSEAEQTITSLREFLDAPVFQYNRAIQTRRELYTQATEVLETLLNDHRVAHAGGPADELPVIIVTETVSPHEEIDRPRDEAVPLAAADVGDVGAGVDAEQIIAQYRSTVAALRQEAAATQTGQEATIRNLRAQNADIQRQLELAWQQIELFLGGL